LKKDFGEGGTLKVHIIRLDIDRKNSAEHLQVGPLGSGLNAVYSPAHSGGDDLARFIRSLLFRGFESRHPNNEEFTESLDGSMQWVDASGHVRMISYASGAQQIPGRYIHSPLHPSERPIHAGDHEHIRGLGNTVWEGDEQDGRWDDLRGDILGMVFCSPIGSVSPEKLWWAASRLGVHSSARTELDEGYQRLKAEEQDILDRLRHTENVDHDRAWWSIERDRLAAELNHVQQVNLHATAQPATDTDSQSAISLRERLASVQIEVSKLRNQLQELVINEANAKLDLGRRDDHRMSSGHVSIHPPSQAHSNGSSRAFAGRIDYSGERHRLQLKIEHLLAEQASVEVQLRNAPAPLTPQTETPKRWDDSQLKQQFGHAEEMLRRWDRRVQSHRRLAEVQSHLRTRSPYRKTTDGSLIPSVEKFLRELTSGAARQLPPWAVEASYLHTQDNHLHASYSASEGHRSEYYDRSLPSANTRQRKLVDLAIRLAIADASVPRVGRIPLLLDDSIAGFRGESLEQVLHVLAAFSRDGRQLLITTNDEYTARRVAAHGGTVSRMQEILRYARPSFILDGQFDLGLHPSLERSSRIASAHDSRPLRVIGAEGPSYELGELNRQLAGLANEQAMHSWWYPEQAKRHRQPRYSDAIVSTDANRNHFLFAESYVQEAPGVDNELTRRLQSVGIYRVADLLKSSPSQLGATIRVDGAVLDRIMHVAELMCGTPQLRAFDAQVLVGCGITRSSKLRELTASELVHRVESFLASLAGQDLLRGASAYEASRIHNWLTDMKRNLGRRSRDHVDVASFGNEGFRASDTRAAREPREHQERPRIARTDEFDNEATSRPRSTRTTRTAAPESAAAPRSTSATRTSIPSRNATANATNSMNSQWKFYLDIDSAVVDAPSIGPRMAERLLPLNISSVGDLIASDALEIADQLSDRNVTPEVVSQWQQQALLVCRIPNLRGHDAQLLVGAGYVTAEQVAAADSAILFEKIVRFSCSKPGVRILRGSAVPDLAEVSDWIQWSQNCRAIRAA